MSLNAFNNAKTDPPIHTKWILSGGANILTSTDCDEKETRSLKSRVENPGNMVLPPDRTTLAQNSCLIPIPQRMIESCVACDTPGISKPK